jgi:2-isopropylmalate synthase
MARIYLYDTTLRDGLQREGMSLSVGEQIAIAIRLGEIGIDYIEAGFPASNPKHAEFFGLLEGEDLGVSKVTAFGMTRRRGVVASDDPSLRSLVDTFAPVIALVGKTWDLHIEKVIRVDRAENLAMIGESVAFVVEQGKECVYDAEHFFDAYDAHPDYAIECLKAAHAAGAEWLTLCDTNGATLPSQIAAATATVAAAIPDARIGIHTHNDAECAVANSLVAVEQGATMVQGTVNGYGERCGNANLVSIIPTLALKMGHEVLDPQRLRALTALSHFVAETANLPPDSWAPYVGHNAFAHKGGMHVAGMLADPRTFEHIDPDLVGNGRIMVVSELSGRGTILTRARDMGVDLDSDPQRIQQILGRVKELEHGGYQFEVADASFELLIERETGVYRPLFALESYRVVTDRRTEGQAETEATIKLVHEGQRIIATGEGNGPVNALDNALRKALAERVPELEGIELVNYKVRILDASIGTAATTRVLIESTDGRDTWGSVGVNENVIEASWEALVDSLEHGVKRVAAAAGNRTSAA